jgi:GNAT superfamily N-acetyltransferase
VLTVREGVPDDTEAIVAATEYGWRVGYRDFIDPQHLVKLPVDRWRHEVSIGLRRPVADAFTYVAEVDGEFAGYCYVAAPARDGDLRPEIAEVAGMYVLPEHWGQGAGAALMRAALERLADLGYAEVVLWTFAENERATGFYRGHGFAPDGAEKENPRVGNRAVRFRRAVG